MPEALVPEQREKLKQVSTATLTTCLFKRGLRSAFIQNVHLINPAAPRMVGEAFTLRYIPAREDLDLLSTYEDFEHPQRKAIETCPAGHVLVMDSRKDARAASAGDILVTRLMMRGAAGVVTDGGFRDTPTIRTLPFAAYHQRPSAPTGPILHHALDVNQPIGCGDVAVYPGDIVVGDGEGVIVLPAHLAAEVADEAFEMTVYEDFVEEKVREGRRIFGIYPATAESRTEFQSWRQAKGR
ncbi:MAG TPA: ribonuclease activity regulator RraA [Geminicoccaceae bacterium]|nr:ribonuclease activity regulator RraA [Geminicoccaceae bacterium]